MSGATYRIEVEPYIDAVYRWKASVVRISDDKLLKVVVNKTVAQVVEEARACVLAAEHGDGDASQTLYVDDRGQDAEPSLYSVKV